MRQRTIFKFFKREGGLNKINIKKKKSHHEILHFAQIKLHIADINSSLLSVIETFAKMYIFLSQPTFYNDEGIAYHFKVSENIG